MKRLACPTISASFALLLFLAGCAETYRPAGAPSGTGFFDTWKVRYSANYDYSLKMRKMPPLHERGVKVVATVYQPYPLAGFQIAIGSPAGPNWEMTEADVSSLIPLRFVEERLFAELEFSPHVKVVPLGSRGSILLGSLEDRGFYNKWVFDADGKADLKEFKSNGIDAILLIQEQRTLPGIRGFSTIPAPSKGLVYWVTKRIRAVAGFRFSLIDTATGEPMKNTDYIQISAEPIQLRWRDSPEAYTLEEKALIAAALKDRKAHNVRTMLQLLKILPGKDGKFLSFDPYEKEPGPEYPE